MIVQISTDTKDSLNNDRTCRHRKPDGSLCKRRIRPERKLCWQHAHGLRRKWRALTGSQTIAFLLAVVALVGTTVAIFVEPVLSLLPGPSVGAVISGVRVTAGNPKGCTVYMLDLHTGEEELQNLYVRVQFPGNIASFNVGTGSSAVFDAGPVSGKAFEIGKKPQGDCEVVQTTGNPNPDVHTTVEGPGMISIQVARALPNWMISGAFAMSMKEASFHPAKMYTQGTYEYRRLGIAVQKSLRFTNTGVEDTK